MEEGVCCVGFVVGLFSRRRGVFMVALVLKAVKQAAVLGVVAVVGLMAVSHFDLIPTFELPDPDLTVDVMPETENIPEQLTIDVESLTWGAIRSEPSLGQATRTLTVGEASKRHYTPGKGWLGGWLLAGSEETLYLRGGVFEGTYYVPGVEYVDFGDGRVDIGLNEATWSGHPSTVTEPVDEVVCDLKRCIGQIFGDETRQQPARTELLTKVAKEFDKDTDLKNAASCEAAAFLQQLLDGLYREAGLGLTVSVETPSSCGTTSDVVIPEIVLDETKEEQ